MIAVLLVSIAFKMKRTGASKKILLICFGTAGIIAATANQIRPTGIILVIAAISMIILLKWIDNEKFSLKTLIMRAIAIALMLTTFFATGILLRAGVSKIIGKDVAANAGGYTLFVGANIESFGSWNEDDAVGVGEMRTGGNYDPTELNDKLTQMGIERLLANPMATIKNMVIKNGIMWATDSYAMIWVEKSNQITFESGEYSIIMFLSDIEEAFYFAAMLFALFGVIRKLKQKSYSGDRSLFIYIIILGYGAAFILAEESNRYHYPALPFLAIAAAIGLTQIQKRNRLQ